MSRFNPVYLTNDDIEDVSSFFNRDYDYCKERIINYDTLEMANAWKKINPKTDEEIRNFYKNTDLYIYELMQASASSEREKLHGKIINFILRNYPSNTFPKMLDYGSGIGTEVIKFRQNNYEVFFADIPGKTTEFLIHRLKRRNLDGEFVPVSKSKPSLNHLFDIIVCFDVLEHTSDPLGILLLLSRHLSRNGVIALVNCPYDDGSHPCHLPHTFSVLTDYWLQSLDYAGLVGVAECNNIYKKATKGKKYFKRLRYILWRMTGLYFYRVSTTNWKRYWGNK